MGAKLATACDTCGDRSAGGPTATGRRPGPAAPAGRDLPAHAQRERAERQHPAGAHAATDALRATTPRLRPGPPPRSDRERPGAAPGSSTRTFKRAADPRPSDIRRSSSTGSMPAAREPPRQLGVRCTPDERPPRSATAEREVRVVNAPASRATRTSRSGPSGPASSSTTEAAPSGSRTASRASAWRRTAGRRPCASAPTSPPTQVVEPDGVLHPRVAACRATTAARPVHHGPHGAGARPVDPKGDGRSPAPGEEHRASAATRTTVRRGAKTGSLAPGRAQPSDPLPAISTGGGSTPSTDGDDLVVVRVDDHGVTGVELLPQDLLESGSSTSRWIARRSGRAPSER